MGIAFSTQTLGLFARVAPDYFTHTGLGTLFLTHGIRESDEAARVSKQKRILGAIQSLQDMDDVRSVAIMRGLIADLIPHFSDSDCMPGGSDPQVGAFIESLEADGWKIESGRLVESATGADPNRHIDLPEHSRNRSDYRTSRRIFVVHGREKYLREQVASFVRKQRYEPCVLGDEPNLGRTVFEKLLEEAQDIAYAIVLLTPDDEGRLLGSDSLKPRARQNVVFEFGLLVGLIGRARVAALVKKDLEMPSDLGGVACISVKDEPEAWQLRLLREMRAAGLAVDTESL